jgi:hypothetical protein
MYIGCRDKPDRSADLYRICPYIRLYTIALVLQQRRQKRYELLTVCPAFVPQSDFAVPKNATLTVIAIQLSVVKLCLLRLNHCRLDQPHRPLSECFLNQFPSLLAPLVLAHNHQCGLDLGVDGV